MRKPAIALLPVILFLMVSMACKPTDPVMTIATDSEDKDMPNPMSSSIHITIGTRTFSATLFDNPTVTAFKARLPMTISMTELNGNEKYVNLPNDLPTSASNPGTIQSGDLMLYGSNTLVLFYKSFPTSYSYTKMGRIDNPADLAAALGTGSKTITFEVK